MKLPITIWPLLLIPIVTLSCINPDPKVLEVFTGQQLFVTKLTPIKSKSKNPMQKFESKLLPAYKVIRYVGDSTILELDWTQCLNNQCPEMGQFEEGSEAYSTIDSLVNSLRKQKI